MVDNNRGRFFLAVEPAYAVVEYVFLLARAGITCYSFHALCITADRIGLTAAAVQECAQPHHHSGHAPYYNRQTVC
jgi:hypothetical protein